MKAFYLLKLNADQEKFNQEKEALRNNEDTESRMELQDEIYKLQQSQIDMVKQVGKLIRQINQQKPLRLLFSRMINKSSIGYLLSGLKGNTQV